MSSRDDAHVFTLKSQACWDAVSNRKRNSAPDSSTTRLDSLDLGEVNWSTAETSGELRGIEVDTLGRVHIAELRTSRATNTTNSGADGLLQGTVLLGVVAVAAEGGVAGGTVAVAVGGEVGRQLTLGRGRVRLGSVVD